MLKELFYPDLIESQSYSGSKTSIIKSHHNVGGLPKKMKLKLVEPFKEMFKDEVRILGKQLGIEKNSIKTPISWTWFSNTNSW